MTFEASAPSEVVTLYANALADAIDNGIDREKAERRATRMVNHAGWYRTAKGWKRLTPDLRDKINIREAVKQPDGRYVIEDVDIFAPTAAKGQIFDSKQIDNIIVNTNNAIKAGGQKPGITLVHPSDVHKAMGTQIPSHGSAVNFRKSTRPGMARCDLVDVDPSIVDSLKSRRLTGLSAGISEDAQKLNRRFGHIAVLGGDSQGISHLPITEAYTVDNQVCFSATSPTDIYTFLKGSPMPMNDAQKKACGELATHYAARAAAFNSMVAGEAGADEKEKQSREAMNSCYTTHKQVFDGMFSEGAPGTAPEPTETMTASPEDLEGGEPNSVHPDMEPAQAVTGQGFSAEQAAQFAAYAEENKKLRGAVKNLTQTTQGLIGRMAKTEFDGAIAEMKREGRLLPGDAEITAQFTACLSHPEPKGAIDGLISMLKSLPKKESPASSEQVFDASNSGPVKADGTTDVQALVTRTQRALGQYNISNDDYALGAAIGGSIK